MKILIEVPDNWLEEDKLNSIGFVARTCREKMEKILIEKLTEKALKEIKMPEIKIDREELKKAVLDRMVEDKLRE